MHLTTNKINEKIKKVKKASLFNKNFFLLKDLNVLRDSLVSSIFLDWVHEKKNHPFSLWERVREMRGKYRFFTFNSFHTRVYVRKFPWRIFRADNVMKWQGKWNFLQPVGIGDEKEENVNWKLKLLDEKI